MKITYNILEHLSNFVEDGANLMGAFLRSGYGASFHKIENEILNGKRNIFTDKDKSQELKTAKNRFYSAVRRLEKDGLLFINKKDRKNKIVKITKKGLDFIKLFKNKKQTFPEANYNNKNEKGTTIIIFDIPEIERKKRDWLRFALTSLDFHLIQKSVWIGDYKIPIDFLEDLRDLKINNFVEIFEVNKKGTLEKID